jgi:hypothetical protein
MAKFMVSVNQIDPPGVNLSANVDSADILSALDIAKEQLRKTLAASGLIPTPVPTPPTAPPA